MSRVPYEKRRAAYKKSNARSAGRFQRLIVHSFRFAQLSTGRVKNDAFRMGHRPLFLLSAFYTRNNTPLIVHRCLTDVPSACLKIIKRPKIEPFSGKPRQFSLPYARACLKIIKTPKSGSFPSSGVKFLCHTTVCLQKIGLLGEKTPRFSSLC